MIAVKPLFRPGRVVVTPGAIAAFEESGLGVWTFLARHLAGDWGVVDAHDKAVNDEALTDGSRLLSAYLLSPGKTIWLISEAQDGNGNRPATTACLPREY